MKNFFQKKSYSHLIGILLVLLIAWVIFAAGIFVGYHKATFTRDRDDTYQQGMGNPNSPFAPFMHNSDEVNPHGTMGEIISVRFPIIMIKGQDSAEQMVVISSTTMIRMLHGMAGTSTIQAGQYAIAIGEPNSNGEIQASFIRIVPPPLGTTSSIVATSTFNK